MSAAKKIKLVPAFQRIKDQLLSEIQAGMWKPGEAIPAEEQLARQFSVSRMTVNRAVRELSSAQILTRIQGSGTYVAQHKYQATLVDIKNIADEIHARGHVHTSQCHLLVADKAQPLLAKQFGVRSGRTLYHSLIVHAENGLPIQVEDRWVNPLLAPDYLAQDFSQITPNAYLMAVAPLQGVAYGIEALTPPPEIARMLNISPREACLVLRRITQSNGQVASVATMWHPGSRYQFAGQF